jgi:hypothetical protein
MLVYAKKHMHIPSRQMYRFCTIKIRNVRKLGGQETMQGVANSSPGNTNGEKNCVFFLQF